MKDVKTSSMKPIYLETIKRTLKSTKNSDEVVDFFIECIKNESNQKLTTIIKNLVDDLSCGREVKLIPTTMSSKEFDALTTEEKEKMESDYDAGNGLSNFNVY